MKFSKRFTFLLIFLVATIIFNPKFDKHCSTVLDINTYNSAYNTWYSLGFNYNNYLFFSTTTLKLTNKMTSIGFLGIVFRIS